MQRTTLRDTYETSHIGADRRDSWRTGIHALVIDPRCLIVQARRTLLNQVPTISMVRPSWTSSTDSIATSLPLALKLGPSILLIQAFSACQRRTGWRSSFSQNDGHIPPVGTPLTMLAYQAHKRFVLRVAALEHDVGVFP